MKFIFTLIFTIAIGLQINSNAQTSTVTSWAYRVTFKDKNGTLSFADSNQFLTTRSLQRRANEGIMLDSTDLPIPQNYITSVMMTSNAFRLHCKSKWTNSIVIMVTDTATMPAVVALPFVAVTKLVGYFPLGFNKATNTTIKAKTETAISYNNTDKQKRGFYGSAESQTKQINLIPLHDSGYMGNGKLIAVIDANFLRVDTMYSFDSLWMNNKIIDTANLARPHSFMEIATHGTDVFSIMGAYNPGTFVGTAPKSDYAFYVSEDIFTEQPIELDNWVAAAERADSIGTDIINASLGYVGWDHPSYFANDDITFDDLDGNTTYISRGVNFAARKGIIVVLASGNWGGASPKIIWAPSDADSSFTVGMADSGKNYGYGSCFGPTKDGRIKPDVMSQGSGVWLVTGSGTPGTTNGTSFAAPIISGAIACLWQALPCLTSAEIRNVVRQSSHLYTTPNDSMGYGVPDFNYALQLGKSLCVLDIDEVNLNSLLKVFPIPTQQKLSVVNYSPSEKISIAMFDMLGNEVYQNSFYTKQDIDMNSFASGNYILKMSLKGQTISKKVIKQ